MVMALPTVIMVTTVSYNKGAIWNGSLVKAWGGLALNNTDKEA